MKLRWKSRESESHRKIKRSIHKTTRCFIAEKPCQLLAMIMLYTVQIQLTTWVSYMMDIWGESFVEHNSRYVGYNSWLNCQTSNALHDMIEP